jgi:putative flippase GtrA
MNNYKKLIQLTPIRYLVVGGIAYTIEVAIILGAQYLGAGPVLAVSISYIVGTLISFALQKVFTFRDTRRHHRTVIPQLLATTALVILNFGFTVLIASVLAHTVPAIVSRTVALGICTIWNFYLYKTRIFKTT